MRSGHERNILGWVLVAIAGTSWANTTANPLKYIIGESHWQGSHRKTYRLRCQSMWLNKNWVLDQRENKALSPMQNPWARVVRTETNGNVVSRFSYTDHIPTDRVHIIVSWISRTPHNVKGSLFLLKLRSSVGITSPEKTQTYSV